MGKTLSKAYEWLKNNQEPIIGSSHLAVYPSLLFILHPLYETGAPFEKVAYVTLTTLIGANGAFHTIFWINKKMDEYRKIKYEESIEAFFRNFP